MVYLWRPATAGVWYQFDGRSVGMVAYFPGSGRGANVVPGAYSDFADVESGSLFRNCQSERKKVKTFGFDHLLLGLRIQ